MTTNVLAEVVTAISEEVNVLAGFLFTRLTTALAEGDTTAVVESTLDWPTSGKFVNDGVTYDYSGKTGTTFTGLTYEEDGVTIAGAKQVHALASVCLDWSKSYSAVDQTVQNLFVRTATGRNLTIVGQNLGIERPARLTDDEVYRDVVQALAYLPRGTMQGLEIALTAFFGAGNFRLWENIPTFRNTVFIEITGGLYVSAVTSRGKTFLTKQETSLVNMGTGVLTLSATPQKVQGVRLADEEATTEFTAAKPSVETEIRFDGDAGVPIWTFTGTSEAADVTVLSTDDGVTQIVDAADGDTAGYFHTARIRPESEAYFELRMMLATTGAVAGFLMHLRDGEFDLCVSFKSAGGGFTEFGFSNTAGTAYVSAAVTTTLDDTLYHTVAIRKNGTGTVELLLDNVVVQTAERASFTASVLNEFRFGCLNAAAGSAGQDVRVKYASFFSHTATDFWNLRGTTGETTAAATLDTNSAAIVVGDVGKALRVYDAPTVENDGNYVIATRVSSDIVTLTARQRELAIVESANPTRVRVAHDYRAFKYPDDVGKQIDLTAATTAPNPGTYVIASILDPEDETAFTGDDTEFSNMVEVTGATFVTETEISWKLLPDFALEAGVSWEMSDAGSVAGPVLTLRSVPPLNIPGGYEVIVETVFTEVESAQLLAGTEIRNDPVDSFFPAYMPPNPLGAFADFIDNLTVAGVIPEIIF